MPLHILIADADVNSALTTAQLLMNNGHLVETCNDGVHALQAVQRRTGEGKPYQVVIAAYKLAGMDAIRLFTELRMKNITPAFALCTQSGALTPQLRTEALKLGCKSFFDYPIPLNQLNDFVNSVGHQGNNNDAPYFGTSKLSKNAEHDISGGHSITPGTNTYQKSPSDSFNKRQTGYNRQSSGAFHMAAGKHTTQRVRRSATGSFSESNDPNDAAIPNPPQQAPVPQPPQSAPVQRAPNQQASMDNYFPQTSKIVNPNKAQQQAPPVPENSPQPPPNYTPQTSTLSNAGGTQRIRRSTTGSFSEDTASIQNPNQPSQQAPQIQASQSGANYRVACAHCQQAFVVQQKAQEYNAVCIHCGGLNRILPR